jgi:hypothetical protein
MVETYLKYSFAKPFYRQSDFLELFSLSLPTLKRYIAEQRGEGKNVSEMGRLVIEGYREICWDPQLFLQWLLENKVKSDVRYDYELAEKNKVKTALTNLSKNETNLKRRTN